MRPPLAPAMGIDDVFCWTAVGWPTGRGFAFGFGFEFTQPMFYQWMWYLFL
jgi:hypothetical protein